MDFDQRTAHPARRGGCVGYSIVEANASIGTGVFGLCAEFVGKLRFGVG
ncbi:hypothetical protein [Lysobacter sp. 22409]